MSDNPWHFWDREQVIARLETTEQGLTYAIARKRLRDSGRNLFPKPPSLTGLVWRSFSSVPVLLWFLLALALQLVGEMGGAIVVGVLVTKGVEIGSRYWLSQLEQRGTLARREFFYPDGVSIVLRDQEWMEISSRLLVIGDLVLVREGDHPAADLRLLDASPDLVCNEVMIGCGAIAPKQAEETLELDTPLYQRSNMIFAGTEIATGLGVGWVVALGKDTQWQSKLQPSGAFWEQVDWRWQNWQLWTIALASLVCGIAGAQKGQIYGLFLGAGVWLVGYGCPRQVFQKLLQYLGIKFLACQRIRINHPAVVEDLAIVDGLELLDCEVSVKRDGQLFRRLGVQVLRSLREATGASSPSPLSQLKGESTLEIIDLPPPSLADEDLSEYITAGDIGEEYPPEAESPTNIAVYCRSLDHPEQLQNALVSVCDRHSPLPLQQSVDVVLPRPHLRYFRRAIEGALIYHDRWQRLNLFLTAGLISILGLMVLASLFGLPLSPAQILWLGAVALPLLAANFLYEPDPEQPPLQLMQGIVPLIIATTAISAATISLFLLKYQGQTASLTTALTMGFTCLFLAQGFHAIALSRGSLIQHWTMTVCALSLAVLQVLMVQVAPLNTVFGFAPLEASEWLIVSFAATSVLWVQEILRAS